MKLHRTFAAALGMLLLFAGPARAVTVNFFGSNDYMGIVSYGQNGIIDNLITFHSGFTTYYLEGVGLGYIPPNSTITFSYNFENGFGKKGQLEAAGGYYQTVGNLFYSGLSSTVGGSYSTAYNTVTHTLTNVPSPVLATANITYDGNHGTTTIVNNSGVNAGFSTYFVSYFASLCGHGLDWDDVVVTYQVSSVPLPGALPMFGMGLAALTGFSLLRRKRVRAQSVK